MLSAADCNLQKRELGSVDETGQLGRSLKEVLEGEERHIGVYMHCLVSLMNLMSRRCAGEPKTAAGRVREEQQGAAPELEGGKQKLRVEHRSTLSSRSWQKLYFEQNLRDTCLFCPQGGARITKHQGCIRQTANLQSMGMQHWCMLGLAFLLLVCQVVVHQLCETLIALVDGFHTVFIIVRMAFVDSSAAAPPAHSSSPVHPPTLHAEPCAEAPTGTQTSTEGSLSQDQLPPRLEGASLPVSPHLFNPEVCGLSFAHRRIQPVGAFISALVLTSLCLSNITEIISFSLDPHPVQHPLLPVVVAAVSLLYKMLLLRLNWNQMKAESKRNSEENHKVPAIKSAEGQTDPRQVLDDVHEVQLPVDSCLQNGGLVLSNPGTSSSTPETDSQTTKPEPEDHLNTAAPQVKENCEDLSSSVDLDPPNNIPVTPQNNTCMGELGSKYISKSSPACLLSSVLITQGLCSPLFAVINSLVTLLMDPMCLHSSGACGLLVYLDPGLSLFAVITLIATAMPQVHRYGLLLLQSTPPHICVSDLGQRIASVPGVQTVHDLHVWQLTGSLTVASVHVHCHAGFPLHRCGDMLSGVTKVLKSVGVSCCTVQPEFACCPGSSAGSGGDTSPVIQREESTLPPLQMACSLTCGKACAGNLCCSPSEEEQKSLLTTPAGETKKEPQTLIIENIFL